MVIRDTADKVAIAERLINANDKAKAEVLVDVELIQVDSTKLRDIGMSLSTYSYTLGVDADAAWRCHVDKSGPDNEHLRHHALDVEHGPADGHREPHQVRGGGARRWPSPSCASPKGRRGAW